MDRGQRPLKAIGNDMMVLSTLVCSKRFRRLPQRVTITRDCCAHQRDDEVAPCHNYLSRYQLLALRGKSSSGYC